VTGSASESLAARSRWPVARGRAVTPRPRLRLAGRRTTAALTATRALAVQDYIHSSKYWSSGCTPPLPVARPRPAGRVTVARAARPGPHCQYIQVPTVTCPVKLTTIRPCPAWNHHSIQESPPGRRRRRWQPPPPLTEAAAHQARCRSDSEKSAPPHPPPPVPPGPVT
jgi:hypothetical protein